MDHEAERQLEAAMQAGVLDSFEADSLRVQAARLDRSPLDLLRGQGVLSEETYARLVAGTMAWHPDAATDVQPAADNRRPAAPETAAGWPLPQEHRFQPVAYLGQGGMGRVFLAWDSVLQRRVAIKFFADTEGAGDFLHEARCLAKVEHDRICQVFEAGRVAETSYLAMRYVEGVNLAVYAKTASVQAVVGLVSEAAKGLHHTHTKGLIHRDVKPSNIMVEKSAGHRAQALVVDFGLARGRYSNEEGIALAGTPPFMAPEQVLGLNLDPRTDVYGLAATLYACLTGRPPISGRDTRDYFDRIPVEEPASPAALGIDLPRDLVCILRRGLEKDRAKRYPSADHLAQDLDAFLRGDLVAAREGNAVYRARKFLRRHKVLTAVAATLILLAAVFSGALVRLAERARARQSYVRTMAEHGEEIEALVRYMHLTPLHDTGPERALVDRRLTEIRREMEAAGNLEKGEGEAVLGRARLALGENEAARRHLERARALNARDARTAYSLALALTRLFQEELPGLQLIPNQALRTRQREELDARFQRPALALLQQVPDEGTRHPHFVKALTAFHGGDLALAEELTKQGTDAPWFYETALLRGNLRMDALLKRPEVSSAESRRLYEEALAAFREAQRLGPSDASLYLAEAALHGWLLAYAIHNGDETAPYFSAGVAAVDKALIARPDMPEAFQRKSIVLQAYSEDRFNHRQDVEPYAGQALDLARRASAAREDDPAFTITLGTAWCKQAFYRQNRGQDPEEALAQALATLARVPETARNHHYFFHLALAHKISADHLAASGKEALAQRWAAVEAWERALVIHAEPSTMINQSQELFQIASMQADEERAQTLRRAVDSLEEALMLQPDNLVARYYMGQCHKDLGYLAMQLGDDPGGHFDEARYQFHKAAEINAAVPNIFQAEGVVWFYQAQDDVCHGRSPLEHCRRAEAANRKALEVYPQFGYAWLGLAAINLHRAHYLTLIGDNPEAALDAADEALNQAVPLMPGLAAIASSRARLACLRAEWAQARGQPIGQQAAAAVTAAEAALQGNEHETDCLLAAAEAWSWRSQDPAISRKVAFEARERATCLFGDLAVLAPATPDFLVAHARHLRRSIARPLEEDGERLQAQYAAALERLRAVFPDHYLVPGDEVTRKGNE